MDAADKKLKRLGLQHEREDYDAVTTGLRATAATPQGRKFLWWLLGTFGTFDNPFSPDQLTMAFAAGRQSAGQELQNRLQEVDPEAFIRAMKENYDEQRHRDQQYADATRDSDYGGDD